MPSANVSQPQRCVDSSSTINVARQRFLLNVGSNVIYVALNTALMMWYIPFLVRHLGVAAYGMIPLANTLVMYAGILSSSLDVSVTRFLSIDINKGDFKQANRTFNTAFTLSLVLSGIVSVPAAIAAFLFPKLFNVPEGLEIATQFLFAGVALTTLVAIVSGTFSASSLITHRFDLRNFIKILTSLTRIGVVALCFAIWPASLWHVTAGFVFSAVISLVGDVWVWRAVTPELKLSLQDVEFRQVGALARLGGWSSVNQIGLLLLMQVDLLIVNAIFGAEMTGLYGSLLLFPMLIHMLMESLVTVLSPAIMACYALGDAEGIRRIVRRSIKLLGLGLAVPVGLLCGFGSPLLTLWLGPEFAQLDTLLVLLVGHLCVNLATRPLAYVLTAYNKVQVQGLVTLALGVANICLAIGLALWTDLGPLGIAASAALVWTIKNVLVLSGYSAALMRLPWFTFYTPLVAGAFSTLGVAVAGQVLTRYWWPSDWLTLGFMSAFVTLAYCIAAYLLGLSRDDRTFVHCLLLRRTAA